MSEKKMERRGLGRGLSALMADVAAPVAEDGAGALRRADMRVPIERIEPNPNQPRRDFSREAIQELSDSIREKGVIQPLIVRLHPSKADHYEIVAGERRWRASQLAQLHELPVILRDFDDTEVLEIAIIENIQRADLNAVEEALGYRQLMERFGHTQEKLAQALSKSRSHIANLMRLLQLPDEVQLMLREGKISAGHARALITSGNPLKLAHEVIDRQLSVRETEKLARDAQGLGAKPVPTTASNRAPEKDADTRALEGDLSAALGMKVTIDHAGQGGRISISYGSLDDLDALCQLLSRGV